MAAPWIAEHRHRRGAASCCCSGARGPPISRSASACPPSGGAQAADPQPAAPAGAAVAAPRGASWWSCGSRTSTGRGRRCSTSTSRASTCASSRWRSSRCSASSTSRRSSTWPTSCSAARPRRRMLLRYFYFQTPQFVYYVIPMAALVATLVTIGVMTKNSELHRHAGVRHQPVPVGAAAPALRRRSFSGVLFGCRSRCWRSSNREADRLNAIIRGYPMRAVRRLNRQWIVGESGDIYHYERFDPRVNQFSRLSMFHLDERAWRLESLTYAGEAALVNHPARTTTGAEWMARDGWLREFTTSDKRDSVRPVVNYAPFAERHGLARAARVLQDRGRPNADRMTYGELRTTSRSSGERIPRRPLHGAAAAEDRVPVRHADHDAAGGAVRRHDRTPRRALRHRHRHRAGDRLLDRAEHLRRARRGRWISPVLAAWAPNILFGAAAAYMLLTVRT